eukprot:scaffold148733_cov35-Attheya_sp.AAC.1
MAQANVAYTTNYLGGVKQFVDDKVTAFHTLNEMDNSRFTTDQSKITGLHDSFQQLTDTWPYAQAITACTDYAKALDLLNNLITIKEHSNRHAAHLSQVQTVLPDIDDDEANILHVNFRDVPPGLQLHNELRNVLSRDTLRLIVQERNDHLEGPNANNGGGVHKTIDHSIVNSIGTQDQTIVQLTIEFHESLDHLLLLANNMALMQILR